MKKYYSVLLMMTLILFLDLCEVNSICVNASGRIVSKNIVNGRIYEDNEETREVSIGRLATGYGKINQNSSKSNERPIYILSQFDFKINGQSADEVETEIYQKVFSAERQKKMEEEIKSEVNSAKQKYNNALARYKNAEQREKNYRNITARYTLGYAHNVDPYDYIKGVNVFIHTISIQGTTFLTCQHSSLAALNSHAAAYYEIDKAYDEQEQCKKIYEEKNKILSQWNNDTIIMMRERYWDEYAAELGKALKPFYNKREVELRPFIDLLNDSITKKKTKMSCPVQTGDKEIYGEGPIRITHTPRCQNINKEHKFELVEDNGILKIQCAYCPHLIGSHKIKINEKDGRIKDAYEKLLPFCN